MEEVEAKIHRGIGREGPHLLHEPGETWNVEVLSIAVGTVQEDSKHANWFKVCIEYGSMNPQSSSLTSYTA